MVEYILIIHTVATTTKTRQEKNMSQKFLDTHMDFLHS